MFHYTDMYLHWTSLPFFSLSLPSPPPPPPTHTLIKLPISVSMGSIIITDNEWSGWKEWLITVWKAVLQPDTVFQVGWTSFHGRLLLYAKTFVLGYCQNIRTLRVKMHSLKDLLFKMWCRKEAGGGGGGGGGSQFPKINGCVCVVHQDFVPYKQDT